MKHILFITALMALLLGACTPAAPTIDVAQVQASAVAAANTMIAMTKAAIPTDTPVPPTPVPSPTIVLPTLAPLPTLAAVSPTAAGGQPMDCNKTPLDTKASGPTAPVVIQNQAKAPIVFVIGISKKNAFGQCGVLSWPIGQAQTIRVNVPQIRVNYGDVCYWTYDYIGGSKPDHTDGPSFCPDNGEKWGIIATHDVIKVIPP